MKNIKQTLTNLYSNLYSCFKPSHLREEDNFYSNGILPNTRMESRGSVDSSIWGGGEVESIPMVNIAPQTSTPPLPY
jgi:hypothetical protein